MNERACFECGKPASHDHHVVPQSLGGTKTLPLCEACHGKIHDLRYVKHRELTKTALRRRRAKGFRTGGVPFGFREASDGRLVIEPAERAALMFMRARRAFGHTFGEIARALGERGIRPKGRAWYRQSVKTVLETDRRYRQTNGR